MFPEGKGKGDGFELIDVTNLTAEEFRAKIQSFPGKSVRLWMPGEKYWLLTISQQTNKLEMAKAMEKFAASDETSGTVVEVFASYVGTRDDVMPAFSAKLQGPVLPQWFVTKEIPSFDWVSFEGVEDDIATLTRNGMRSMQVVRRLILEGNIRAAASADEKALDDAVDCWARAAKRNPNDSMLAERMERLKKNAEVFFRLGKYPQALKCYETLVVVKQEDAANVYNFGICLQRLGREELAKKVLARAKKLAESR
jgi:tetratricopeptide (TPR) repeat protein